jgi:adenylylsulfate kinase-like enzyme/inorganic pyrophosphatase
MRGNPRVVAFQTRNPLHNAHVALLVDVLERTDAIVLLHPTVGVTKPDDVPYHVRVRCYEVVLGPGGPLYAYSSRIILALIPLAMRFAGPKEAVHHMIIRKNYGATDIIIGRDHAGIKRWSGENFYASDAAWKLAKSKQAEIGINVMDAQELTYVDGKGYIQIQAQGDRVKSISGSQLRKLLESGSEIPDWFTDRRVASVLRQAYPPLPSRGLVILLVGLSGSGKTTLAAAIKEALESDPFHRVVTLLDGDEMRRTLSNELGFSADDRATHMIRMGFVASEIAAHRGTVIISTIAPIRKARNDLKRMVEQGARANFVLVHVATSVQECRKRDPKGLYAKADAGLLPTLSGVGSTFEPVVDNEADVVITRTGGRCPVTINRNIVIEYLIKKMYIQGDWHSNDDCRFGTEVEGKFGTLSYRVFITKDNERIKDIHQAVPLNLTSEVVRMVVEIPLGNNAKLEYKDGAIRPDVDSKGDPRVLKHPTPIPVNYGFIPQTLSHDGDPLDAIEISGRRFNAGEVIEVLVIGMISLDDQGIEDSKVVTIATRTTEIKALFHNLHVASRISEWFITYKKFEGLKENLKSGITGDVKWHEVLYRAHHRWKSSMNNSEL